MLRYKMIAIINKFLLPGDKFLLKTQLGLDLCIALADHSNHSFVQTN